MALGSADVALQQGVLGIAGRANLSLRLGECHRVFRGWRYERQAHRMFFPSMRNETVISGHSSTPFATTALNWHGRIAPSSSHSAMALPPGTDAASISLTSIYRLPVLTCR